MSKVTEIIPDDLPEWAEEAIAKGQFFREAVQKVETLQAAIDLFCDSADGPDIDQSFWAAPHRKRLFDLRSKQ